jgi:hypothetical protein
MDTDTSVVSYRDHDETDHASSREDEERSRKATEAVQAAEAAMYSKSPLERQSSQRYVSHSRLNSSLSSGFRVQLDDLARAHPLESEAEAHILKALEATEAKREEEEAIARSKEQDDEAVAKLFTPVTENLLGNVPEGAEGIFQPAEVPVVSSVAGNSTNGSTTESPNRRSRSTSNADSTGSNNTGAALARASLRRGLSTPAISTTHNHRRQLTMEETLQSLNQAFDSVDRQAAAIFSSDFPPPSMERLPGPRTTSTEDSGPYLPTNRPRTTSLDLFNENMARLFQDVGVNDTRVIPVLEEETIPLTTALGMATLQTPDDNSPDDGSMVGAFSSSEDRHASRSDMNESPLDGERISSTASDLVSSNLSPRPAQEQGDIETGTASACTNHDLKVENIRGSEVANVAAQARKRQASGLGKKKRKRSFFFRCLQRIGVVQNVDDFIKPRRQSIVKFSMALFWLLIISIAVAVVLFYLVGNPPTGIVDLEASAARNGTFVTTEGKKIDPYARASHSWWILFACVRLPIAFALARFLQALFIDFLILERRCIVSCMGPTVTLLLVQSKGWPATLFFWSLCNMGLLYGDSPFVAHWAYWQSYVKVFNESNPSGSTISSDFNLRIQLCALGISVFVAIKRLLTGFYQGRKIFLTYAEDLSNVMAKILLISEVSNLAVRLEKEMLNDPDDDSKINESLKKRASAAGIDSAAERLNHDIEEEEEFNDEEKDGESSSHHTPSNKSHPSNPSRDTKSKRLLISDADKEYVTGRLSQSQKRRIERLLGNWEEPERESVLNDVVSIGAILQFRTSLAKIDTSFPFSFSFGRANNRNACIESSQKLYLRLVDNTPDSTLHFNILGLTALQRDGSLDQEKLKSLIRVFRPGRDGRLGLFDFIKSVVRCRCKRCGSFCFCARMLNLFVAFISKDSVYKEMKLLKASVRSSQKIDHSFERIFNFIFFVVIGVIVMSILGLDPLALFVSVSTFVLAFSFMISRASSNYFEGLLFILCRRPYDIGVSLFLDASLPGITNTVIFLHVCSFQDRIVIQPAESNTSWDGTTDWIVRDIDLFTTTVIYAYTNEIATLSNGSIANSRVMNGARSLPGLLYATLRFGIDVTHEQLEVFREALNQYVIARPREWTRLWDVRNTAVSADQGFVEYLVIVEHRDNWQNLDGLLGSRGTIRRFCHELAKQLDMRYVSPPLPVDLRINDSAALRDRPQSGELADYMAEREDLIRTLIRDRR